MDRHTNKTLQFWLAEKIKRKNKEEKLKPEATADQVETMMMALSFGLFI